MAECHPFSVGNDLLCEKLQFVMKTELLEIEKNSIQI